MGSVNTLAKICLRPFDSECCQGCVTPYSAISENFNLFSSCTACAALDDAPAMFCLSPNKDAETLKF